MAIIYNIEKFVVEQMFLPYKPFLVSEDNLPENGLEKAIEYEKRVRSCTNELRKHPERIMVILRNNKKAYECVFGRLAKLDFKFYKWLKHPLIDEIESIVLAYRIAEREGKK